MILKSILLSLFCILVIVAYVFCKKYKDVPLLALILSGVSVVLLIAVIITGCSIKNHKEDVPAVESAVEDESVWAQHDDESSSDDQNRDSTKIDEQNENKQNQENGTNENDNTTSPIGAVSKN